MIIKSISDEIYNNSDFFDDYQILLLKELKQPVQKLSLLQIKRLLESSLIFSLSDKTKYQKLAFKISIFMFNQFRNEYDAVKFITEIVMTRLGNLPTITKMHEDGSMDYFKYFTNGSNQISNIINFPETITKKITNRINILNESVLLTNFQADIFNKLNHGDKHISISGPASSGKSFVVRNHIIKKLSESDKFVCIYVAPTKALISEIQQNFKKTLEQNKVNKNTYQIIKSTTILNSKLYDTVNKKIIILTQERLQKLLEDNTQLDVDILVVDEAQKIVDGGRGMILEDAVSNLIKKNTNVRVIFISPYINNPEIYSDIFDLKHNYESILEFKTPVGQNIFYITMKSKSVDVSLYLEEFDKIIPFKTKLENLSLPTIQLEKKIWIMSNILQHSPYTLVYCNAPQDCINIAIQISQNNNNNKQKSKDLDEKIDFLKKNVHEDYYLVEHLRSNVGYHYGNMPQFVRSIVQELFDKKLINFLCCTSTLLEGVNLPARNIVIHNPKYGRQTFLDKFAIKNLAGRAGRLGKDYFGNIYCIDIKKWKHDDIFNDVLDDIQTTSEKILIHDIDELKEYVETPSPLPRGKKDIYDVATNLMIKQLKNPKINMKNLLIKKYPKANLTQLYELVDLIEHNAQLVKSLDVDIIINNSTFDPRSQYSLYEELLDSGTIDIPEPSSSEFYNELLEIFIMIEKHLYPKISTGSDYNYCKYYAVIAFKWINQHSYKNIIESSIKYRHNKMPITKKIINNIIKSVDKTIELDLKFRLTKGLQCYCDIVNHIQKKNGIFKNPSKLPKYLESGVKDDRVFLLLDMGLTRNNAISINHMLDGLNTIDEILTYLKQHLIELKNKLHPVIYNELKYILDLEE